MKTITVKVDAQGFPTVSDDNAGSCGEHNNLTLKIEPNTTFFQNCEYFKLNIDGRYSERLTKTGSNLEYTVPQAALCPPEINCQVVGFKTVNEKSVLICRTKTFKLKVEPSPGAYLSINTDVFEPLETAIAHCGNITAAAEEQIAELGVIAGDLTTRADEIEAVAKGAAAEAEAYAAAAEAKAYAAGKSQEAAEQFHSNAASAALAAENSQAQAAAFAQAAAQSAAEAAEATNAIAADVKNLKGTTETLTADTESLKGVIGTLRSDTASLKATTAVLTTDSVDLKTTTKTLTTDVESLEETTETLTADTKSLKETTGMLTTDVENLKETAETLTANTESLKETTETLTADSASLKETAETLTADIENLKHRVNVDASDGLEGRINRILRELYFDFSSAEADYTASYIDRIRIGRNVNGRWFVEFGKASYQETLITFSEDSERYDVITAQNADGVKAYAVIDWSELPEGGAAIYSMLSLNSVDEIGAWPAIYAYINGEKIKETISGGGTGEDGISPIVDIIEIENGHRVEITDAYGAKAFDVLNGKDGVGITKIEYLTNTENSDVYAIYFTDGTYTPINIPKGKNGADGYTPQKGSDYFTEADKAEMVAAVISALPKYEGEVEAV